MELVSIRRMHKTHQSRKIFDFTACYARLNYVSIERWSINDLKMYQ